MPEETTTTTSEPRTGAAPRSRRPLPRSTAALVALNLAAYILEFFLAVPGAEWAVTRFGQDRLLVWAGEYWRLGTALFIHGGSHHLALNMLFLFLVGRALEPVIGGWRFLAVYLLSGLGGSLLFQAVSHGEVGVGASGAIYGIFGVLLFARFGRRRPDGPPALSPRFLVFIGILIVFDQTFTWFLEWVAGISIASSAHLGGLLSGVFLGHFVFTGPRFAGALVPPARRWSSALGLAAAFTFVAAFGFFCPKDDALWLAWRGFRAELRGDAAAAEELYRRARGLEEASALEAVLKLELRSRRHEPAVAHWRRHPLRSGFGHRELGFRILYDGLMAGGEGRLAAGVLEDLVRSGEKDLQALRSGGPWDPLLYSGCLNSVAWYRALLAGRYLEEALPLAQEAVAVADNALERVRAFWPWERRSQAQLLGSLVNTLGYVEFLLGRQDEGLRDLRRAAELSPVGPNFLYLAMAYHLAGNEKEARAAARQAEKAGLEFAHERDTLKELKAALGED